MVKYRKPERKTKPAYNITTAQLVTEKKTRKWRQQTHKATVTTYYTKTS